MLQASRGLIWIAVSLMVIPSFAGCLSSDSSEGTDSEVDSPPARVGDRLHGGGESGTGDLLGTLTCDDGHPIPEVHVLLVELDLVATTDAVGDFEFQNLAPGTYTLRMTHEHYKTKNETVTVVADKMAIFETTLTPNVPVDHVGNRPHVHDYWQNRSRLTLFDGTVNWGKSKLQGGSKDPLCLYAHPYTNEPVELGSNCWTTEFWLNQETAPDGVALVPPGTKELEVDIGWQSLPTGDNPPGFRAYFQYKPADRANYLQVEITNGDPVKIPVSLSMADHGHQQFSLWQFQIYIRYLWFKGPACCGTVEATPTEVVEQTVGPFHVNIVATPMSELPLEPEHPRFWAEGPHLELANLSTLLNNFPTGGYPSNPKAIACTRNATACFTLPDNMTVPPGTTRLVINLTYKIKNPAVEELAKDLFQKKKLLFRTAAIPPREATRTDLRRDAPTQTEWGRATWTLSLNVDPAKPNEADAVYERHSLWLFLLASEGSEDSGTYSNDCGSLCSGITYTLTVEAFNDQWRPDAC